MRRSIAEYLGRKSTQSRLRACNFVYFQLTHVFLECYIHFTHADISPHHRPLSALQLLHSSFPRGRVPGCYIFENVLVSLPHTTWCTCSMQRKRPIYRQLWSNRFKFKYQVMRVFSFLFGITRSSVIKVRIKLSTAIAQSYVCVGVGGGGGDWRLWHCTGTRRGKI